VVLKLLNQVLTLNNFVFNDEHFLQIKGCAMGTICAPSYAKIFMGRFESERIYPKIESIIQSYLRYIDDVFLIWTGSKEEFERFVVELSKCHESIKFDYEISDKLVNFLDTAVYITEDGTLKTKLHTKPTDRQNYLHHKSAHPNPLLKSIPFGQALRVKRICSEEDEYKSSIKQLKDSFLQRGYKGGEIDQQLERANNVKRESLFENKTKNPSSRVMLITKYNRTNPDLKKIFEKHWHLLQLDEKL